MAEESIQLWEVKQMVLDEQVKTETVPQISSCRASWHMGQPCKYTKFCCSEAQNNECAKQNKHVTW